jgi:hypothetical protein
MKEQKESEALQEIEKRMVPLRKLGMSEELVALGIERSRILSKRYGDK